jgi:hypothetical protein
VRALHARRRAGAERPAGAVYLHSRKHRIEVQRRSDAVIDFDFAQVAQLHRIFSDALEHLVQLLVSKFQTGDGGSITQHVFR